MATRWQTVSQAWPMAKVKVEATPAPITPPTTVPAPGTILISPVNAARPTWVAAVAETTAISAARSNLIL